MAAKKTPKRKQAARLTREQFLDRALDVIDRDGRGWIGVHELVEQMGVTTGSFYWHFKNRDEFVEALLDRWFEDLTGGVAEELRASSKPANERLLQLALEIVDRGLDRCNAAMKIWARREPVVAAAVREVDSFRWEFVEGLFREIGFRGRELKMRARTFFVFYSSEAELPPGDSKAERRKLVELRHRMLVHKL